MDEFLIHVTDQDEVIGPIPRDLAHTRPDRPVHRCIHLLLFHPMRGLLLQRRSRKKDICPNLWDTSVGGHVSWGETYDQALRREAWEELGVKLNPREASDIGTYLYDGNDEREMVGLFTLVTQQVVFNPDPEEIAEYRFFQKHDIETLIIAEQTTPHFIRQWQILPHHLPANHVFASWLADYKQ